MPYEVHTPVFEGDLELLTQLVSRQELDVFGLCLASLVEAFLADARGSGVSPEETAAAMEAGTEPYDLDTSTEFLLLAATLIELKTRYLLIEDDDDVPDELPTPEDRDLLLARLLQGRTFKEAARVLAALIRAADRCAPRRGPPPDEPDRRPRPRPWGAARAPGTGDPAWNNDDGEPPGPGAPPAGGGPENEPKQPPATGGGWGGAPPPQGRAPDEWRRAI